MPKPYKRRPADGRHTIEGSNSASPPGDRDRQCARLGGRLFVEISAAVSDAFDRDPISGLIFLTLAGEEPTPGAAIGVPTATRSLAEALDLPFETVRRHVRKLRRAGVCDTGPDGVRIPPHVYLTPSLRRFRTRLWIAAQAFLEDARRLELAPPVSLAVRLEDSPGGRRIMGDFFLDALSYLRGASRLGPLQAFVMAAAWVANIARFLNETDPAVSFAEIGDIPGDDLRTPVTAYSIAKGLSLPYETVRRTLAGLIEQGLLDTACGGLIVPARIPAGPAMMVVAVDLAAITRTLIHRLTTMGEPAA